jgi:Acetyl xylan esterase (AXE1)
MPQTGSLFLFSALLASSAAFAQRGPVAQRPQIQQQLTFTPDHAGGIYDIGETVGWTVTPGPATPTYAYKWTVRRNNAVVLKEGKLDLSSGKDRIEITGDQPEMIYVAVEPYASLTSDSPTKYVGGNTGRDNGLYAVGAAVAPSKLTLSTPRPTDFDEFWNHKLAEQAKIPIHPVLTPVANDVQGVEMSMLYWMPLAPRRMDIWPSPLKKVSFLR